MDAHNELRDLHEQLAELYRGRSTDQLLIRRLWLRIEAMEAEEAKYGN